MRRNCSFLQCALFGKANENKIPGRQSDAEEFQGCDRDILFNWGGTARAKRSIDKFSLDIRAAKVQHSETVVVVLFFTSANPPLRIHCVFSVRC
jgi:hypothetical protein